MVDSRVIYDDTDNRYLLFDFDTDNRYFELDTIPIIDISSSIRYR